MKHIIFWRQSIIFTTLQTSPRPPSNRRGRRSLVEHGKRSVRWAERRSDDTDKQCGREGSGRYSRRVGRSRNATGIPVSSDKRWATVRESVRVVSETADQWTAGWLHSSQGMGGSVGYDRSSAWWVGWNICKQYRDLLQPVCTYPLSGAIFVPEPTLPWRLQYSIYQQMRLNSKVILWTLMLCGITKRIGGILKHHFVSKKEDSRILIDCASPKRLKKFLITIRSAQFNQVNYHYVLANYVSVCNSFARFL